MTKLVAVDNHILGWGIREHATPGQEDMIERTKMFFEESKKNDTNIMIPAIVLAELLSAIEPKHHPMVLNLIRDAFYVAPFDAPAAAIFAKLWQEKTAIVKQLQGQGATRQELKADGMIVATAIAQKAGALYSHDDKLKSFAGVSIEVLQIPRVHIQTPLDIQSSPLLVEGMQPSLHATDASPSPSVLPRPTTG